VVNTSPARGGIYIFWTESKKKCLYVGKAEVSIRDRMRGHWNQEHNKFLEIYFKSSVKVFVQYEIIDDRVSIPDIEKATIRRLKPVCNDIRYERDS
jgi:excinuclease UvrABC nuclease subunit